MDSRDGQKTNSRERASFRCVQGRMGPGRTQEEGRVDGDVTG